MSKMINKIIYFDRIVYNRIKDQISCLRNDLKIFVNNGSKEQALKKFNYPDDDLDLAHDFLEKVLKYKAKYGYLISFDVRVLELCMILLRHVIPYIPLIKNVCLIDFRIPYKETIPLPLLLDLDFGYYHIVSTYPISIKAEETKKGKYKIYSIDIDSYTLSGRFVVSILKYVKNYKHLKDKIVYV